jgi:pyruvate kinase
MNKTKIIATITDKYTDEKLIAIAQAGVNILRLNFSHAQRETTAPLIQRVHKLNASGKTDLGLLLDTKGPEVRTGDKDHPYTYQKNEQFRIFIDKKKLKQESDMLSDYPYLLEDIKAGNQIVLDGGLMTVTVDEVTTDHLLVTSRNECEIRSRRHMNFPGIALRLP